MCVGLGGGRRGLRVDEVEDIQVAQLRRVVQGGAAGGVPHVTRGARNQEARHHVLGAAAHRQVQRRLPGVVLGIRLRTRLRGSGGGGLVRARERPALRRD